MNITTQEIYTVWNEWLSKQPSETQFQWNEKLSRFEIQSEMERAMESIIESLTAILVEEPHGFKPSKNQEMKSIQKDIFHHALSPSGPFLNKMKDEWDRSRWIHAIEELIRLCSKK